MSTLALLMLGLLGGNATIDGFSYPTAAVAQNAWVARSGTPPVEVARATGATEGETRPVLKVLAPFAARPKLGRTAVDTFRSPRTASLRKETRRWM